jgi:asparagine synthase (glutamine-hydrolysing)
MCGIAGLWLSNARAERAEISTVISIMTSNLAFRGPDASGVLITPDIAFGHRRLSILDLTFAGAQPMRLGSGGPVITYNGEVYNFKELRQALNDVGSRDWRGHSDTEVILHVYAEWGLEGLKRLEGIFSFALWDPSQHRLVLMRDRLGVKPLFFGDCRYGLAFGSEIKAVLAAEGVGTDLNDQAFSEYLWYGNSYGDRTFYKGVHALEPGHWLVIENGRRTLGAWWRIEEWLQDPPPAKNVAEASVLVRKALDQAVFRQLVADVPVGLFLSGGVDSSSIAAAAIHQRTAPLQSYAAGFDFERGVNELPKAARVARHLNLEHNELRVSGRDLESVLVTLARAHDEPFADAANIPLYLMCQQLQGRIKVVLQGDGGDELFAGYRRYAILRNAQWWRFWPNAVSPLLRSCGNAGRRFARIAETVGNSDAALRMAYLLTVETQRQRPEQVFMRERQRHLEETTDPFLAYRHAARRFYRYDPVQQMLLTDLTVQLPAQFLTKVDRATMAAGIEARVPLLDERVARLAVNLPSNWKVDGLQKKIVLRNSQRDRLPDDILDGPKTGFGVPFEEWLRTTLFDFTRERILDENFVREFDLCSGDMERMLTDHRQRKVNRGFMLWKLLQLAIWNSKAKARGSMTHE